MALPVWPAGLPKRPRRSEFSVDEPHGPALVTQMQSGRVRMRRQFTVALAKQTVAYMMTGEEYTDIFVPFVRDDLGLGTSEFTMPVWNGSEYVTRTCQLVNGQYKAVAVGLYTIVTMNILIQQL